MFEFTPRIKLARSTLVAGAAVLLIIAACVKDNLVVGPTHPVTYRPPARGVVPMLPPNEPPADLAEDDSLVGVSGGNAIHRTLLWVAFASTTDSMTKQADVDSISGEIAGGYVGGDGVDLYYVRVPDDTIGHHASLHAAAVLRGLSGVIGAAPVLYTSIDGLTYLKPTNGPGWRVWGLHPDSTTMGQYNWQQQALDLPRAWGCSVGDDSTRVRIIDERIHTRSSTHVTSLDHADPNTPDWSNILTWHGDATTEILADPGNNNAGMTGVMWKANVRQTNTQLYDSITHAPLYLHPPSSDSVPNTDPARFINAIAHASANGERVISISLGSGISAGTADAHSDSIAAAFGQSLTTGLSYNLGAQMPLVVVSAGNGSGDAGWSGYPRVTADVDFGEYVIAVASSQQSTTSSADLETTSGRGSLVEIDAPGHLVYVVDDSGTQHLESGTSFSTPTVAGIAGLLFSFDPRQTADTVKQRLIHGALNGGRTAGGIPIANGYESLKLAARGSGAPLCGDQRIWAENGNIYVARDSGASPEEIAAIGGSVYDLDAYHGGHYLEFQTDTGWGHLRWTAGLGWAVTTAWDYTDLPGGSWSSAHGLSHDEWAVIGWDTVTVMPGSQAVNALVVDTLRVDSTQVSFSTGTDSLPTATWYVAMAYPQQSDSAVVAIDRMRGEVRDSVFSCLDDRSVLTTCHDSTTVWTPDTTYLYTLNVNLPSPTLTPFKKIADSIVYAVGFAEDDRTLVASIGTEVDTVRNYADGSRTLLSCQLEYRDSRLAGAAQRSIADSDECPPMYLELSAGTFSANLHRPNPVMQRRLRRLQSKVGRFPLTRRTPIERSSTKGLRKSGGTLHP